MQRLLTETGKPNQFVTDQMKPQNEGRRNETQKTKKGHLC